MGGSHLNVRRCKEPGPRCVFPIVVFAVSYGCSIRRADGDRDQGSRIDKKQVVQACLLKETPRQPKIQHDGGGLERDAT